MHGPVGAEPENRNASDERGLLLSGDDHLPGLDGTRSENPHRVHVRAHEERDQKPHLDVELEAPRIDRRGYEHDQPFCRKNLKVANAPQYTATARIRPV